MTLYYCLAKTTALGEIIIQGNSETYSATASALDSSDISFADAAQVATKNSNTAVTITVRMLVDNILAKYAYVLSDENISSMISNSLKTTISPIIPIALGAIASSDDGINYKVHKDVTILEDEFLTIPSGKSLKVDASVFLFENYGAIEIGDNYAPTSYDGSSQNPCCASGNCVNAFEIVTSAAETKMSNYGVININSQAHMKINKGVTYDNYGSLTNSGCIFLDGGVWTNVASDADGTSGSIVPSSTGKFYSSP